MELDRLKEVFKDYEFEIGTVNNIKYFVIKNPYWKENIEIEFEWEYTFFFSFHHAHFCEEEFEELIEYTKDFLSGKRVALVFLKDGKMCSGGDMIYEDIDTSSIEKLFESYHGGYEEPLFTPIEVNGFLIHGWDCTLNKEIERINVIEGGL
jgi:hypothetical protein